MAKENKEQSFALCIENKECGDLEKRKIYGVLPDDEVAKEGYLRIVDESGEDYLYPESYFILVELPIEAQDALQVERRCEDMTNADEILDLLPGLSRSLLMQESRPLRNLRPQEISESLQPVNEEFPGVYLFSDVENDAPLYVGRTSNLPTRIGTDHRSTDKNLAPVTKAIMNAEDLDSMETARERLYEICRVRMLVEPDADVRAMLEIYVALKLRTQFNRIEER